MHIPVLSKEIIETLNLKKGDTVVDCTLGGAGHTSLIAEKIGKRGRILALDEDRGAILRAETAFSGAESEIIFEEINFRDLDIALSRHGIKEADKILFDIGLSSDQLESSGRGFSFRNDEPLLMTFSVIPKLGQRSALEIVNALPAEELERIIREYGEERFSRRIAESIVASRKNGILKTTGELRDAIIRAVPKRYAEGRIDPATRTFQAIRIAVNDELGALKEGLKKAGEVLSKGGRIAVISFHSLEDRIVKQYFRELSLGGEFRVITKRPIVPGEEETENNPRARSAKLRVIEKIR